MTHCVSRDEKKNKKNISKGVKERELLEVALGRALVVRDEGDLARDDSGNVSIYWMLLSADSELRGVSCTRLIQTVLNLDVLQCGGVVGLCVTGVVVGGLLP